MRISVNKEYGEIQLTTYLRDDLEVGKILKFEDQKHFSKEFLDSLGCEVRFNQQIVCSF